MDLFTIQKTKDIIYHGTAIKDFKMENRPCWFALTEQSANKYAGDDGNVHNFQISKPLKLLDITNTLFHADFMSRVNLYYAHEHNTNKARVLVPLGLPDLQTQINVLGLHKDGIYPGQQLSPHQPQMQEHIEAFVPYIANKHRYSVGSVSLDKEMVEMMIKLYPDHHGYISPIMWPSYHLGGFLDKEMCIFSPTSHVELITSGGSKEKKKHIRKSKKQVGGQDVFKPALNIMDLHTKYGIPYNQFIKVNPNIFE